MLAFIPRYEREALLFIECNRASAPISKKVANRLKSNYVNLFTIYRDSPFKSGKHFPTDFNIWEYLKGHTLYIELAPNLLSSSQHHQTAAAGVSS